MLVSDLTERALIARLQSHVPPAPDWVITGIGDDAAVLAPARGMVEVVTTDAFVEHVHFRLSWSSAVDIGHKAVTANLSDIAAMGAEPRAVLLSLGLPSTLPLVTFDGLIAGVLAETAAAGAALVGGNISRSHGPLTINITVTGAARARRTLRRSGARPGDRLFVTGSLGASTAGLRLLTANQGATDDDLVAMCVAAHRRPSARLRVGQVVARNRAASAGMDLSDGLADAVQQLAEASRCGATIDGAALPIHAGATHWAALHHEDPMTLALTGGEDYELLFAVPKRRVRLFLAAIKQAGDVGVSEIGECTKDPAVIVLRHGVPEPLGPGFGHF